MVYTIKDMVIIRGVNNTNLFDGFSPAARFAVDIFTDGFSSCTDKRFEDLEETFKT